MGIITFVPEFRTQRFIPRVSRNQQATDRDMTIDHETDEITTSIQVSLRRLCLDGLSYLA